MDQSGTYPLPDARKVAFPEGLWSEYDAFLTGTQRSVLTWVSAGFCLLALAVLRAPDWLLGPGETLLVAGMLWGATAVAWLCYGRLGYATAAWVCTLASWGVLWALLTLGRHPGAGALLALPVGLGALMISGMAGGGSAVAASTLVVAGVGPLAQADAVQRAVALVAVWGTFGMLQLVLRPMVRTVGAAWAGYERSREALQRVRDYHQRLRETLDDLSRANEQLTRLHRLAQVLRQTADAERQAKEQFVANVSHELRTPLNMIIGFCEMITEEPGAYGEGVPSALLADLEVVLRNSQHLSSLIDDVLDLSQIEAGQMALTKEWMALEEVITSAAKAVEPLFASKGLYLCIQLEDGLPTLFCDRLRIREVILNLLSNAGRFTEEGGVTVRAWQEAADVVVEVADTGPGIPAEARERLFRPFEQLDGSIRRRYGGTGLGLSISKGFVEQHGGALWVQAADTGGTSIRFRLPIDIPLPAPDEASRWIRPSFDLEQRTRPSSVRVPPERPRLLLIRDRSSLRRILERHMHEVQIDEVDDLEQASALARQAPTHGVLWNVDSVSGTLAELQGLPLLPPDVPLIVCSVPGLGEAARKLGVADYLVKPVSREAFARAVAKLGPSVETVLLVDDDEDALQLFTRFLSAAARPYRVLRAYDGQHALATLQREPVDAILLDLAMPTMDGFRFLEERRADERLRNVPVILISARDPLGQPIVSSALGVTSRDGISMRQLIRWVQAATQLGLMGQSSGVPGPQAAPGGR